MTSMSNADADGPDILIGFGHDDVVLEGFDESPYVDFQPLDVQIIKAVWRYTVTSPEKLYSLIQAVRYIVQHEIPGDIVECGVWKGGSMMAAAYTLLQAGQTNRQLYLYDTFDGMPRPSEKDVRFDGAKADEEFEQRRITEVSSTWANASLEDVWEAMGLTGYPVAYIHLIKGRVEDTLPKKAPERVALLRLDTDWYESTRHELIHLFPRLSSGGVVILDDYGHWLGARKAVDEYINDNQIRLLLNRVDYSARIGVKE